MVVARILVIADDSGFLEGELTLTHILGQRVQAHEASVDVGRVQFRAQQYVAAVHLVTPLVDELDDVEARLRLHHLADLLGVGEGKGHVGKGRIQHGLARITQFTALAP